MKKKLKILIVIIVVLVICCIVAFLINYNRISNVKASEVAENSANGNEIQKKEQRKDIVIIKNGDIQNENLIDNFINTASSSYSEELTLKIYEYSNENEYVEKYITYYPGTLGKSTNDKNEIVDVKIPGKNGTYEEFKEVYGYYNFNNGVETKEYRADTWIFERIIKDDKVQFRINVAPFVEIAIEEDLPIICTYSVSSSEYTKKFDLIYNQRRDVGVYKIYEDEIGVYTFGGDVDIVIEGDMVYSLQDALYQKVISIEDIVKQAEMDLKYGVCYKYGMYSDGGSKEYYYNDYTILKYNKLDGTDDLVIGFRGTIINQVDISN